MRFLVALVFVLFSFNAHAIDAPDGQVHLSADKSLRGHFVQLSQLKGATAPIQTSGHFTVAPARGLLWSIEQPFPTTSIITSNGAAQDIGGMAMKLPAKNLRHIFDMVAGALAGDWSKLSDDYDISESDSKGHWQMTLTPKADNPKLSYSSITVTGARFVENISLLKEDGNSDTFTFGDVVLSSAALTPQEAALFNEVH